MTSPVTPYSIFAVEDDPASLRLLQAVFQETYALETFASAEACLARLDTGTPDLFLLDVGLPGVDGYELCRQLKDRPASAHLPVIFISGHVELESRLRGYEVGAHDFIVKPFDLREVRQKVEVLFKELASKANLENRLTESDTLTALILSNLDEYAVVLKYLRELNSCADPRELADMTHTMLRGFGLSGAVQLRLPGEELTIDAQGANTPIMVSIMNHVRTLERIFEFHRHGVYNFDRITLMVDNMPVADAERCGRLRDHLAIAIETADARLKGLLATATNTRANEHVGQAIAVLRATVAAFTERYAHAQHAGGAVMRELMEEMRAAFIHLGMTQLQEESILDIIQQKMDLLVGLYDAGAETNTTLVHLEHRLTEMQTLLKTAPGD